tara:strand:- start:48581 stop:49345 length:765 start_codon:yes stop_codon:yes gene_type:complete
VHKLPKFRSIICATIAAGILFPGIASAEDATWSGFYGGLALGGTYGESNPDTVGESTPYFTSDDPAVQRPYLQKSLDDLALNGSVLGGYDHQSGQLVYGIEADLSVMDYSASTASGPVRYNSAGVDFNINSTLETNFAFSIRPKIGYAVGNWMFHAAAGPSIGYFDYDFRYTDTNAGAANDFSKSTLALGISSGLGSSYKLDNGWVLRGDYVMNYYPKVIDERQSFVRSGFQGSFDHQVDFQSHNLRFAVIKRF